MHMLSIAACSARVAHGTALDVGSAQVEDGGDGEHDENKEWDENGDQEENKD